MKTRPNDPCPCFSGKKFKKCCRTWIQQDIQKEAPAELAKHQIDVKCMLRKFEESWHTWPKLYCTDLKFTCAKDIPPFTPVTIFPIHYIHGLAKIYAVHPDGPYSPYCSSYPTFKLVNNLQDIQVPGVSISVSSNKKIIHPNQYGHVLPVSETGNVVMYHLGMYCCICISIRTINANQVIERRLTSPSTCYHFKTRGATFIEKHHNNVVEVIRRFKIIRDLTKNCSEKDKAEWRQCADKMQDLQTITKEFQTISQLLEKGLN